MAYLSTVLKFLAQAAIFGCLVAAAVFFLPGALAAITSLSLFGVSIPSLVGSNILLQTAAVAGLFTGALFSLGLLLDLTSNCFSSITSCCRSKSKSENTEQDLGTNTEMYRRLGVEDATSKFIPNPNAPPLYKQSALRGAPAAYHCDTASASLSH